MLRFRSKPSAKAALVALATLTMVVVSNSAVYAQQAAGSSVSPSSLQAPALPEGTPPEAVAAAREYIRASITEWESEYKEVFLTQKVQTAQQLQESSQNEASRQREIARVANEKAARSHQEVAMWARDYSRQGVTIPKSVQVLLDGPSAVRVVTDDHYGQEVVATKLTSLAAQAAHDLTAAEEAQAAVEQQVEDAARLAAEASLAAKESRSAREIAATAASQASAQWDEAWRALNAMGEGVENTSLADTVLSHAMVTEWNSYLDKVKELRSDVPKAADLTNTNSYPEGLTTFPAINITDATGVAFVDGVIIPSQEAIDRVTRALALLGEPYVDDGKGEDGWGCQQLIMHALNAKKSTDLSTLYESVGRQNVSIADTQPGDVVFFSDPQAGIHQAGVYVLGGLIVNASAASGAVSLDTVGVDALASVRPGAVILENSKAPAALPNALPWKCGGIASEESEGAQTGWVAPLPKDAYDLGAKFNATGARFGKEGKNPGLEFLSVEETASVAADFDGVVTSTAKSKRWGQKVVIEHSDSLTTTYSLLDSVAVKKGAKVKAGSVIGTVGTSGEASTGSPGVIVSIMAAGVAIDPQTVFFPENTNQYKNGQIPKSALCPISTGGLLRCDAARSFEVMDAAFKAEFGKSISVTDSYRSFAGQVRCRATKGSICATPGKSNHGWGLALDLGGGINNFGTPSHRWMQANAARFGWSNPQWAQQNGSMPEPWHWEFYTVR